MYDSIFITAPKNEFVIWEEILNIVASSLEFTDTFLNGFNQQQDAVMKNFQSIRNICNQISDGIMDSWNKRSASFDIMSQKQSDATLGYERVYDTETNEVYKAYNGFTAMRQTIPDILRPNRRGKTLPGQANGKDSPFCARKSNGCSAGQGRVPPNRKHISSAMRPCGIKKSRMLIKRSKSVRCPPVWEKQPWNYHILQKHMEIMY